ncbi:MAG: rod shape-determining protein MreD [Defluviitaleaceae bacterium]|nr:rod shape-determining protein MreD [Defluviitaleaceae bacterium]
MRIAVMVAIVFINFVLQTTLLPQVAILGVTPDTALVLIVSYAILRGEIEGALFGLFTGLVQDLSSGLFIGLFALFGFVAGYVCGKPFKDFFKNNYFLPFAIVMVVSLAYQFALYVTTVMFTGQLEFGHYFRTIILPKTIYTASLSIPLYSLLHWVNTRLKRHEARFQGIFRETDGDDAK